MRYGGQYMAADGPHERSILNRIAIAVAFVIALGVLSFLVTWFVFAFT